LSFAFINAVTVIAADLLPSLNPSNGYTNTINMRLLCAVEIHRKPFSSYLLLLSSSLLFSWALICIPQALSREEEGLDASGANQSYED